TDDGVLTEFDLGTGAVRHRARVLVPHVDSPFAPSVPSFGRYSDNLRIEVYQNYLVLTAETKGTGFPLLQSLYYDRRTFEAVTAPSIVYDGVQDCGEVLCVYSGEQVSIVDPQDFSTLWVPPPRNYPN